MATTKIPVITREFYRVPVTITVDGGIIDPTTLVVEWALVDVGSTPIETDWVEGSWETLSSGPVYLARILVGDSSTDFPLTQGSIYDAWIRITDDPERPTRLVGQIQGT